MEDWLTATAAELGRGIDAGRIDPVDLTEAYLTAIGEHRHRDRIYARLTEDRARAEARAASDRAKAGLRRSPLDGVPISWKDLFDTAGVATEAGTALLKGRVPTRDAKVLANATRAGLVCLGKTHMSELAFSGLGYNPVTASPPCVNDPDAVSGGSSSGAAASVAFGLAAAGIGSDTGGSVRVPAGWNDLVGLKTLCGRLSLEGVVPLRLKFDTVGPLCRSVEDAAMMRAALGQDKQPSLEGADLKGMRFGLLRTVAFKNIADEVAGAFEDAAKRLQDAGAVIEDIEIEAVSEAMTLPPVLFSPESYGIWKDVIEANPDVMFKPILDRFRSGAKVLAADYVAAWIRLEELKRMYAEATARFDAVILPTCPILPPKMAAVAADGRYWSEVNLLAMQNTFIGNLMDVAGLTLPTGVPSCGILFQGPSEERLLRLGKAAEEALS